MKNKVLNSIVFIIGYILSPLTWWNDTFINIPIAYFFANIALFFLKKYFLESLIFFYWFSNCLGIYMMFISGKNFLEEKTKGRNGIKIILSLLFYTLFIGVLAYFGALKPLSIR